ncbi:MULTISPECIES: hypothetical protein [Halobacillus]|uniref:hypothetical protein n=1 Tax=Halobacillus TaxID=45667 RepID=UPI0009A6E90E|nr:MULTISPECIES: hypothetical protein [Halobacillus]
MQLQISVLVNKEINEVISRLAKRMGTSKRNIISLALSNILKGEITRKKVDQIKMDIHGLTHATNITVNQQFKDRLDQLDHFGLSRRRFFGLLVCDYFYKHSHEFLGEDILKEDATIYSATKANVQITIDKTIKNKLMKYCTENAISLNSLIAHYVMNKTLTVKSFHTTNKDFLHLTFGEEVKEQIQDNAEEMNMSERYYLNLIMAQISIDLGL